MKTKVVVYAVTVLMLAFASVCWSASDSVETMTEQAVTLATQRLKLSADMERACLTNALSAVYRGKSTRRACDVLDRLFGVGLGRGNLLTVHEAAEEALWFVFVGKKGPGTLAMVRVGVDRDTLVVSDALNVYVGKETSFEPFQKAFGKKAFALVTLANGWADGVPWDLMMGGLYHDHLCCGVCSGYCTVNFIRTHLPLKDGQSYMYIGAPAWCQDDYIMGALNLTPGKHGYYTMNYPWSRPWNTGSGITGKLGGILIRYDRKKEVGTAHLLSFNWQEAEFKTWMGRPDMALDWKTHPWLHVLYTRFLMARADDSAHFVSVLKTLNLNGPSDLNRLTAMGANPLEQMLGPDKTWKKEVDL